MAILVGRLLACGLCSVDDVYIARDFVEHGAGPTPEPWVYFQHAHGGIDQLSVYRFLLAHFQFITPAVEWTTYVSLQAALHDLELIRVHFADRALCLQLAEQGVTASRPCERLGDVPTAMWSAGAALLHAKADALLAAAKAGVRQRQPAVFRPVADPMSTACFSVLPA